VNKKVIIVENSEAPHENALLNVLDVFLMKNYKIILFLSEISKKRLYELRRDIFFCKNIEIIDSNINSLLNLLKKINNEYCIIYNTISLKNVLYIFLMSFKGKNVFYISNINSWFVLPKLRDSDGFFNYLKGIILHLFKKVFYERADCFIVGSFNMQTYLKKFTNKHIYTIPFNSFKNYKKEVKELKASDKIIKIVIPGNIELRRKNLNIFKKATKKLSKEELKNIKIILLGRPITKEDKKFVNEWKKDIGDSLEFFETFVDNKIFTSYLKEADYIASVINVEYIDKYGFKEIYGISKDTGVEAHAIAYGKPLIINKDYKVDENIIDNVIYFESEEELVLYLKNIAQNKYIKKINYNGLVKFDIRNIYLQFKNFEEECKK
jgi:hypothetical protein